MITLTPPPRSLGLHSPVIGPWFSSDSIKLGLADQALAVPLSLDSDVQWCPPSAGFLSFYIATSNRPPDLAGLRCPTGRAFDDGRLIALFELLPQARERLAALMRSLPTLGNPSVSGLATRPPLRGFALEFEEAPATLAFLEARLTFGYPAGMDTEEEKLAYLGLSGSASALANAEAPMRDLYRPGATLGQAQALLKFPQRTNVRLWAFDVRGRAVDPGAAACWWLYMATHASNGYADLFAEGVEGRTAAVAESADRLLVELVNPHEGQLDPKTLARVEVTGNAEGSGTVRYRGSGSGAMTFSFTPAPTGPPDDLPVPRLAVLPDGRLDSTASLFKDGPLDPILRRDHVRICVLSMEQHLVGQVRSVEGSASAPQVRRAADQNRPSTQVLVARASRPALLDTHNAVAQSAMAVLALQDGAASLKSGLVASVLSTDWGFIERTLPDVGVPASIQEMSVKALTGGGTAAGSTVANQSVLATVDLGAGATGAWVRCWPQGFDSAKGERFRLDGGAAIADSSGIARLVMLLPDGEVAPAAPMGADVLVVTAQGRHVFADRRFERPAPVGGQPVPAGSASGPFLLCEEGREVAELDASSAIQSGTTVIAMGSDPPAIVDRTTIAVASRSPSTLARSATSNTVIQLTQPAFLGSAQGDGDTALGASGATVNRAARVLPDAWKAGFPLPGLERRELVAVACNGNVGRATIGGGMALANRHGLLPHSLGHPLSPAGPDFACAGIGIQGPAIRSIAEFVRERTSPSTIALAQAAADADIEVPATPAADSLWVAGLRTVAAGVESEVGLAQLLDLGLSDEYPFGAGLRQIRDFLGGLPGGGISLPGDMTDPTGRVMRALDRRFLAAARGSREAATSLAAALARAEDLVFMESAAIDDRKLGNENDTLHWLQILIDRMAARPALRVVICLPVFFDASVPKPLQRIRDLEARRALDRLVGGGREPRVAVFSPSAGQGRTLKAASTLVVVDDAWAMVGSTHLWRRGLSFDSSFAASIADDRLVGGRPQEIQAFRRLVCAHRLGVTLAEVPDDPAELVASVRALVVRGGFGRLAADRVRPPSEAPTTLNNGSTFTEEDVWNPDGSPPTGLNPLIAILQLTPQAVSESLATP